MKIVTLSNRFQTGFSGSRRKAVSATRSGWQFTPAVRWASRSFRSTTRCAACRSGATATPAMSSSIDGKLPTQYHWTSSAWPSSTWWRFIYYLELCWSCGSMTSFGTKTEKWSKTGSGFLVKLVLLSYGSDCGTVGWVVASGTRDLQFEYKSLAILLTFNCFKEIG